MKYRSRPVEVEAMQWAWGEMTVRGVLTGSEVAYAIVAWVNANFGEARYEPEVVQDGSRNGGRWFVSRMVLRTVNGLTYAYPGDYIVMGESKNQVGGFMEPARFVRDFYPVDPEAFEKRFEQAP